VAPAYDLKLTCQYPNASSFSAERIIRLSSSFIRGVQRRVDLFGHLELAKGILIR
jgi:hypothetical protein